MFNSIKKMFAKRAANELWKQYDIIEEELYNISRVCLDTKSLDLKHRVSIHYDRIKQLSEKAEMIEREVRYRWENE